MNLAWWLARSAQRHGERTAIGHGLQPWCSYAELARRASRLAAWLHGRGVAAGDRVGLWLDNRPEYLVMLWATWWAGAAAVPINAKLHPREVVWILQHSGARLAFVETEQLAALGAVDLITSLHGALPELPDDAPAVAQPVERSDTDAAWLPARLDPSA